MPTVDSDRVATTRDRRHTQVLLERKTPHEASYREAWISTDFQGIKTHQVRGQAGWPHSHAISTSFFPASRQMSPQYSWWGGTTHRQGMCAHRFGSLSAIVSSLIQTRQVNIATAYDLPARCEIAVLLACALGKSILVSR